MRLIQRQAVGSILTLMFRGTAGNLANIPIGWGMEYFNENYLQSLRDDADYDPYQHGIVYTPVAKERILYDDIYRMAAEALAGPYGPLAKTGHYTIRQLQRWYRSKKPDTKAEVLKELQERLLLEIPGNFNLIPFYKDFRRAKLKQIYNNDDPSLTKAQLKKLYPALYDMFVGD